MIRPFIGSRVAALIVALASVSLFARDWHSFTVPSPDAPASGNPRAMQRLESPAQRDAKSPPADSILVKKTASAPRGVEIVQTGGYPELHVDGKPFFIHSAAFFYYRIPRDLWSVSLDHHRDLGINTIDLYIPWNWHEPREGELDFDGHSNPRRDLRALLQLISEKGFKLIARPGPVILNEWRHGGYPEWLLERPEYAMDSRDRIEGRYAPLTNLNPRDAEGAAKGWLENPTHMRYAQKWLAAVAKELATYSSRGTVRVKVPAAKRGEFEEKEISGPLLFVQLDDDMAIGRSNYAGPIFWRYMSELRSMLESGGIDVPAFINPTDMRVSAAGFGLDRPIGAMGQYYLQPPQKPAPGAAAERKITAREASTIEFFVEELKTQPAFPPLIIEYQAAWYTPGDDSAAFDSPVANTLLSSRLLLAHGLHGFNYFPAQDSITPAGYSTPWTNRHYRWDAALDAAANQQSRARAVTRNGMLMDTWNEFLASSHKRADFGIIYPLGAFPQETLTREDIQRVSGAVMKIARVATLAGFSTELLDPHYQPPEQLLRHPLLLLPVFDSANAPVAAGLSPPSEDSSTRVAASSSPSGKFALSEKCQHAIVEYVRRGGTLLIFPARPAGAIIERLWKSGNPLPPGAAAGTESSAITSGWTFGQGRVYLSTKDFYSWVSLDESFSENRARFESAWATQAIREFVSRVNLRPAVQIQPASSPPDAKPAKLSDEIVATQLVSSSGTSPLGARASGAGLLSVTNLSYDLPAEKTFAVLSPRASARASAHTSEADILQVPVSLPPRESLLLPLHFPLCTAATPGAKCEDEVTSAGAELLSAERTGKTLELTFYTPARATIALHFARQPGRTVFDEDLKPETRWLPEKNRYEVDLLRGPAPQYLRVLKINLPYTPQVPEKPDPSKLPPRAFEYSVVSSVRLPLTDTSSLPTYPPLVVLDENLEAKIIVQGTCFEEFGRDIDFNIDGAVRGSGYVSLEGFETRQAGIDVKPAQSGSAPASAASPKSHTTGLLSGELQARSGRDRRTAPMFFAVVGSTGVTSYQFDFDRDSALEWVLENAALRLIVSPEDGGRALALVDKSSGLNVTTNVGALRDRFAYTPPLAGARPDRARGRYGLFNRPYVADWVPVEDGNALRLTFDAPEIFPAGAKIVKTARLSAPDTLAVDYDVRLHAATPAQPAPAAPQEQAFIVENSVPVTFAGERTTQFCWTDPSAPSPAATESAVSTSAAPMHCEAFVPGRDPLEIPDSVRSLEIRTPGRLTLIVDWSVGHMTVDMKNFSALLRVQFPLLVPGSAAGLYNLKFRVLPQM